MADDIPLIDSIAIDILMHRDVHFGGSFEVMIQYYEDQGVGVMPDFTFEQIEELQNAEKRMGGNLSDRVLSDEAKQKVKEAKEAYFRLRSAYETSQYQNEGLLISDLIFSEEETPAKEMHAIVVKGKAMLQPLIDLISSPSFYDPLFPGYGRIPIFAASCLAKIGDEKAILPLFEAIGHDNFFTDEAMIKALLSFGEKSKSLLIKRLSQKPLSKENEHAAIALNSFAEDQEVAKACLKMLLDPEVFQNQNLAAYLVFSCTQLKAPKDRESFKELLSKEDLNPFIKSEIEFAIKNWDN